MINKTNIYLYLGALISQLVTLITSFIILKFISPEVYGRFTYIIAIGSILGSFATLKFEQSISISINLEEAFKKVILSFQTSFFLSIFSLPFLFFLLKLNFFNIFLIFLLSISIALFASLQQFFLFSKKYKQNSILSISIAILNLIFFFTFYKMKYGLEISYIFSYFLASLFFIIYTNFKIIKFYMLKYIDYKNLFTELAVFPKVVFPGAVIGILLLYANPIVLKYLYTEREVGMFSFTTRVLTLPVILVSSVSSGLFKVQISKYFFEKDVIGFQNEKKKLLLFLIIMMFLSFFILLIAMNNIDKFSIFHKWDFLGFTSNLLVLYAISQFLYLPFTSIPLVLKQEKILMQSNIVLFCLIFVFYILVYLLNFSFEKFLLFFSIINFLFSIYYVIKFYNQKI